MAAIAGVGRWKIVRLEAAELGDLLVSELERCFDAVDARIVISASWHGAALDRLLDEVHARVVASVLQILEKHGWKTEVEVSFAVYGERGSIDILAWHPGQRALLVIEVKSELGSVDGLLRPLDVKLRHSAAIARERFGWDVRTISKLVVFPNDR